MQKSNVINYLSVIDNHNNIKRENTHCSDNNNAAHLAILKLLRPTFPRYYQKQCSPISLKWDKGTLSETKQNAATKADKQHNKSVISGSSNLPHSQYTVCIFSGIFASQNFGIRNDLQPGEEPRLKCCRCSVSARQHKMLFSPACFHWLFLLKLLDFINYLKWNIVKWDSGCVQAATEEISALHAYIANTT